MFYDLNVIAANKVLVGILVLSLLAGLSVFIFQSLWRGKAETWPIGKAFAVWLAVYLIEYYIFGPYSFISFVSEGNLSVSYNHYLATHPGIAQWSHHFVGGIDAAVVLPGVQFVQFEILLEKVVPTWIVILIHKGVVGSLGFWGIWLLARAVLPGRVVLPFGLAGFAPLTHDYLLDYSTEFGTGFAVVPLAVYVGTVAARRFSTGKFWWTVGFMALVVAMAQPMKVFPALFVAYLSGMIFFGVGNWWRTIGAFAVFSVVSAVNWIEVLYGLLKVVPYTGRGAGAEFDHVGVSTALGTGFSMYGGISPATLLLSLGLVLVAARARRDLGRMLLVAAVPLVFYVVMTVTPWQYVNLAVVNRVAFDYSRLAIPTIAALVFAAAFRGSDTNGQGRLLRQSEIVVVAAMIALMTWVKLTNAGQLIWFGGQGVFVAHDDLKAPTWKKSGDLSRVVTLFDTPHPNVITAFYGMESLDGGSNFDILAFSQYWYQIMRERESYKRTTRTRIEWDAWDGRRYDLERHLRTDLLKAANVRYILSGLPLKGDGLRQVDGPDADSGDYLKSTPSMYPGFIAYLKDRVARIFAPGTHYVYEMEALPRVYAAKTAVVWDGDMEAKPFHDRVAQVALARSIVVGKGDVPHGGAITGAIEIRQTVQTVNGYDVSIDTREGGVLVLNQNYTPFWRACDGNGRSLDLFPVNGIHMAAVVPAGTSKVWFEYDRATVTGSLWGGVERHCPNGPLPTGAVR